MKKLIIFYSGIWSEKLLTIDRYKEVSYFVDDNVVKEQTYFDKKVYPIEVLTKENPDNIIIIVSDNLRYNNAKQILEHQGFIENKHFFNGWKLDFAFYKLYYGDNSWQHHEEENSSSISQSKFDVRAKTMSTLIPKNVKSILDIGCGVCDLKKYIASDIHYYGLDYCYRDGVDYVCDFNQEVLPNISVDMYYMAGIIYYIDNINLFFSQLKNAKYILFDYGGTERYLRLDGVPADPLINARNNFIETDKLFNILRENNFVYENGIWDWRNGSIGWHIYLFRNLDTFNS